MKHQLHISKILSSNHTGFIKIASNYFSISAVKYSGVNAVAPLVRQSIFSHVFHMLRVLTRFYPRTIIFLYVTLLRKTASICLELEGYLWETKWVRLGNGVHQQRPQSSGQSGFGLSACVGIPVFYLHGNLRRDRRQSVYSHCALL